MIATINHVPGRIIHQEKCFFFLNFHLGGNVVYLSIIFTKTSRTDKFSFVSNYKKYEK